MDLYACVLKIWQTYVCDWYAHMIHQYNKLKILHTTLACPWNDLSARQSLLIVPQLEDTLRRTNPAPLTRGGEKLGFDPCTKGVKSQVFITLENTRERGLVSLYKPMSLRLVKSTLPGAYTKTRNIYFIFNINWKYNGNKLKMCKTLLLWIRPYIFVRLHYCVSTQTKMLRRP